MYEKLLDRFIEYAKKDTRSDAASSTTPTTQQQVEFAKDLVEELKEIGLSEVEYNEKNGFVTATLPANTEKDIPVVGFISHLDTADFNSVNVQPQVHENYDGEDIALNQELNIVLSPKDFPELKNYIGQTLITTDGTTLLGADDKSGIAEIMCAVEYLLAHPEIEHGKVRVAFGPDEEIGRGADLFDVEHFAADLAFTVDSGAPGRLDFETFNAAQAVVTIKGVSVHPGTAKNQMVNAIKLAMEFDSRLPSDEVPEKTEGHEGFYLLNQLNGTVEDAEMIYIIRDHDSKKFQERKEFFTQQVEAINDQLGTERLTLEMEDQYYNMKDIIEKDPSIMEMATQAIRNVGLEPIIEPFRGGTDGSKISYMGLPTPNLFAGGENAHGKYEYVSLQAMEKATDTILEIIRLNTVNNQ